MDNDLGRYASLGNRIKTLYAHDTLVLGLGICMMMISILLSFGHKATSSAAITFFFLFMLIFGGE